MDELAASGRMWLHAVTRLRGIIGLATVLMILFVAVQTSVGISFVPPDLLAPGKHPWISWMAWGALAFLVYYAPGRALLDYKQHLGNDFYRWDIQPNVDRAYRIFDRLHRDGRGLVVTEDRQVWDEKVRKAMIAYCDRSCLDIYLSNTGRHTSMGPLPDDRYNVALEHLRSMLKRQLERDIKPLQ